MIFYFGGMTEEAFIPEVSSLIQSNAVENTMMVGEAFVGYGW